MNHSPVEQAVELLRTRLSELEAERLQMEAALAQLARIQPESAAREAVNGILKQRPVAQRRREGGTRAEQAIAVIGENPGIGASDIAAKVGVERAYIYHVLRDLTNAGHVIKLDRTYRLPG